MHLTYGTGPRGSKRLRAALSTFFASHFHSFNPLTVDQILPISGVGALIDALTWCICGDGEGILFPQPLYTGFQVDVPTRSRGRIVPVGFEEVDDYSNRGLDGVFDKETNERALERAFLDSQRNGVVIRAVLITKLVQSLMAGYQHSELKEIS
jgi:hypothetical protein